MSRFIDSNILLYTPQALMQWSEINEVLALIKAICPVESFTVETHHRGVLIAEKGTG